MIKNRISLVLLAVLLAEMMFAPVGAASPPADDPIVGCWWGYAYDDSAGIIRGIDLRFRDDYTGHGVAAWYREYSRNHLELIDEVSFDFTWSADPHLYTYDCILPGTHGKLHAVWWNRLTAAVWGCYDDQRPIDEITMLPRMIRGQSTR